MNGKLLRQGGFLFAVLVIGLAATAGVILAHGGGAPQVIDAEAGPYRVFVWTEPEPWRAGDVHITVAITLPPPEGTEIDETVLTNQLDKPVTDATVRVHFFPPDSSDPFELPAPPQSQLGGIYYETDTNLLMAGDWEVGVIVEGPLGAGGTSFAMQALPARRMNWLWLGGGVLGVLALVALLGLRGGKPKASQPSGKSRRR